MDLFSIFILSSEKAIKIQQYDGSMTCGNNGPYNDLETPVRNTSHWLITFLKSYELTGDMRFKTSAENCLRFLMSKEARPMGATFWHRKNPNKDFTNGVIGQAWTLEALVYAYQYLGGDEILKLAEQVFNLHPYCSKSKAWKVINVDGSIRAFDPTYNHQLWMAAIGSLIAQFGDPNILASTKDFVEAIPSNIRIYRDGVIKHHPDFYLKRDLVSKIRYVKDKYLNKSAARAYIYDKSVGYHGFNLFALALIAEIYPSLPFFKESLFLKSLKVIQNERFQNILNINKYAYPYNPAGLELAYAAQVFSNDKNSCEFWVGEQFKKTWDPKLGLMNLDNPFDKATAAARLYEGYKLDNVVLNHNG